MLRIGDRIFKPFLGLLVLHSLLMNGAWAQVHFVRPGDTLSRIARKKLGAPVYGKDKNLERILKLNPTIKDANRLRPGQGLQTAPPDPLSPSDPHVIVNAPPVVEPVRKREVWPEIQSSLGAVSSTEFRGVTCNESSVGNHAKFFSNASKMSLSWTHQYSSKDFLVTKYAGVYEVFDDKSFAGRRLTGKHQVKHNFSVGWARLLNQSILNVEVGSEPRLFNYLTSDSIVLDQTRMWTATLGFQRTLIDGGNRNLSAHGSAKYLLPANGHGYKTKSGMSGLLGTLLTLNFSDDFLATGGIYYEYTKQDSTLAEQRDIVIGLSIGFGWRY